MLSREVCLVSFSFGSFPLHVLSRIHMNKGKPQKYFFSGLSIKRGGGGPATIEEKNFLTTFSIIWKMC